MPNRANSVDAESRKKQGYPIRRIVIGGISYTIRPFFIMPYMTGDTGEIEKALFMRKPDNRKKVSWLSKPGGEVKPILLQ